MSKSHCKLFAQNGAFVVIVDIQDELGVQVAASIGPQKSSYRHRDVRVEKHAEETVAFAIEKYGTLDIMHSNAGIMGPVGSILDMDMDAFDNTMSINLSGSALAIKHAARVMVERQIRGSIICTGSVTSTLGGSGPHPYTTSKHALVGLVRLAANELGKHGIRVNCVSPSGLATGLVSASGVKNMDKSAIEALATALANLKGIVLNSNHVAEAVLFLASDESVYVSGHNLAVDGGVSVVNTAMTMMKR
ncbi:hypothetical protein CsSME_00039782 [Camellia sinensis var. sinensis]